MLACTANGPCLSFEFLSLIDDGQSFVMSDTSDDPT